MLGIATTTAAEEFARRRQSPLQRVQHVLHGHPSLSPLIVLVIAFAVFSALNPRFAQPASLSLLLQQVAVIGALAVGQTLIILTAGIDLSVGAVTILAMMVAAKLAEDGGIPGVLAVLVALALGVVAGLINGALVTRISLPPFIVTLGTLSVFTAIGLLYTSGQSVQADALPALLNWTGESFGVGRWRITWGVVIVVLLYLGVGFALANTAWGRHVYAVGDDKEAARLAGIRVDRVLLSVYAVAGAIYGLTAWILIGRAGAASPNAITDANLESITAVVIGGTSLFGGRGALLGTLLGALIVGAFRSGLSLAGVDDQYRVLAVGLLVIVAVGVDQWIRRVKA
ncbi:permease component of ribose/xylose/arabinose/galactoside ABC-type transporter [Cryptosporangium arvum DSM 44712]|uniref:Permease component of ribose/xylose/arabinose/galactoside ABC-type transporter n=1 Tax=Cryptosporangium arvum DSM 44712 TaxID=927661 RepID=A0A011ALK3_9ACTN|nr:ABC transporter permease [Cryptosporangium arvum]EXG82791.1 permease component of ribose/xylose/arabinose/galactoside ABC-type transporter [Cryptosporangium arvum DSM 44712]